MNTDSVYLVQNNSENNKYIQTSAYVFNSFVSAKYNKMY